MSILSGFKKVKDRIMTDNGYQLISRWTSAQTVEYNDGTDGQTKMDEVLNRFKYPYQTDLDIFSSAGLAFLEDINSDGNFMTVNFENGDCILERKYTGLVEKYGHLRGVIVNGIGGDRVYAANIQNADVRNASIYIKCISHPNLTEENVALNVIYIWKWIGGE